MTFAVRILQQELLAKVQSGSCHVELPTGAAKLAGNCSSHRPVWWLDTSSSSHFLKLHFSPDDCSLLLGVDYGAIRTLFKACIDQVNDAIVVEAAVPM